VSADGAHPADAQARAYRATLPTQNNFDIETLLGLPPYWNWVEHQAPEAAGSFRLFLGGSDDGVALRLFWNGSYENKTLMLWMRLARRHNLALDIGAHTGIYTLAAHAANPDINILSFEPDAGNFARLALNLRANGNATKDAYMLGVSDTNGTGSFTTRAHCDYRSSGGTFETVYGGHVSELRVVTLDSFLPPSVAAAVGLIKLDIEGHEPAALSGMRTLIERSRPTVIFECLSAATAKAAGDMLRPLGYRFHEIDDVALSVREIAILEPVLDAGGDPVLSRLNRVAACRAEDLAIIQAA
jgi:FkbM family methyltransferase